MGTRCATHKRVIGRRRGTSAQRGYDAAWTRIARAAVRAYVELYGWVCPGWQRAPHPSTDLTADHVDALARGGASVAENIGVLCRSCNGAKGGTTALTQVLV